MVYYRKYRPQTLEELIGQESVKKLLKNAYLSGRLAHAYLFCGPKGTGKTSTARILAKMVNCESQESRVKSQEANTEKSNPRPSTLATGNLQIPCNSCTSCKTITDGSNLDLIEIDAASNRGIDDIRELRDKVKLAPTSSKKKVYIIDEVHMLTNEAFNALLKTLEEPPAHTLFILATTELHKVPATIQSRVQKLDFQHANLSEIKSALQRVAASEKIQVDEAVLEFIAKKSEGSFRDALKLFDQLAANGEPLTLSAVESLIKSGGFSDISLMIRTIAAKDAQKALELIAKEVERGINIKEYTGTIIDTVRALLLLKNGAVEVVKKESGVNFEEIQSLVTLFTISQLVQLLQRLLKSVEQLKFSTIPSLPLEIAVVESCFESESGVKSQESVGKHLESDDTPSELRQSPDSRGVAVDLSSTTDDVAPISSSGDLSKITDKWVYILETIKPYNYSLEALLKQVKVISCVNGLVVIEVPYSFHQRILEAPKSRSLLESVLSDVLGQSARVSCVLGQRPIRVEEIANVELAADDEVIKIAAEIFNSDSVN